MSVSSREQSHRPVCASCQEPIAEARWHVRFGWVYVGYCDECHAPNCGEPACGERDLTWEGASYSVCRDCVAAARLEGRS